MKFAHLALSVFVLIGCLAQAQERDAMREQKALLEALKKHNMTPLQNDVNISKTLNAGIRLANYTRGYVPEIVKGWAGMNNADTYEVKFSTADQRSKSSYDCYLTANYQTNDLVLYNCTVTTEYGSTVELLRTKF